MAKVLKTETYKGYKIGFKKNWNTIKQIEDIGVQIYDKNNKFIKGFYSTKTKKELLIDVKNIIDKEEKLHKTNITSVSINELGDLETFIDNKNNYKLYITYGGFINGIDKNDVKVEVILYPTSRNIIKTISKLKFKSLIKNNFNFKKWQKK